MELHKKFTTETKWINLNYPLQTDLRETDMYEMPSMHFYMCIGYWQLFIRKSRTKYIVCTRGYQSALSESKRITAGFNTVLETRNFQRAKNKFCECAKEIARECASILLL